MRKLEERLQKHIDLLVERYPALKSIEQSIIDAYLKNDGYTSPNHKLTAKIESIFEDASGRIIISSYAQNAFRTQEIAQLAKKYNRKICFYGRDKYDNTNSLMRIAKNKKKPSVVYILIS